MANLTIRSVDYRVADRLIALGARNKRLSTEEARDILSRAVGIEPKSGLPPPPKGHPTPWVPEGIEVSKSRTRTLTVRNVTKRVLRKLEASARRNKRTASAEARTMLTEAIGFDRPLRKGEESALDTLIRAFAPLHKLNFEIPPREELRGPVSIRHARRRGAGSPQREARATLRGSRPAPTKRSMASLTIRSVDYRVADRLIGFATRNKRLDTEEARDILSRAVGIEPKSGFPPPPKGHPTPWVPEGIEVSKSRTRTLTVRDVPQRVLRKLEASARRNKRTTSAEARTILTEAIGFNRPLRKGEESAHDALTRIFAPLRKLKFEIPPREELRRPGPR